MDLRYEAMSQPPQNALKPIDFGALKGKSDINPQWRIEALTEQFGLCGLGWKFEIVDVQVQDCPSGERLIFMAINLYVKNEKSWSAAIPGIGGNYIIKKTKSGLTPNDEAYKMCLTDALGNAAKCIGVAADIYRGNYDGSKYINAQQAEVIEQNVRTVNGHTEVFGNSGWVALESMTLEQLNFIANSAKFQQAHGEARRLMMEKGAE